MRDAAAFYTKHALSIVAMLKNNIVTISLHNFNAAAYRTIS